MAKPTTFSEEITAENGLIKKSCKICNHAQVCSYYESTKNFLAAKPENIRPFNAEDLALICKYFSI